MRTLMMIATMALTMGGASLVVPAVAQQRTVVQKTTTVPAMGGDRAVVKTTVVRHDDNGRHMGRHRHCQTVWKHHHRVTKCRYY